jgi:ATP-dependent DNA helicase RecG
MAESGMEPPVFQSDRGANLFIATLWLHNLLDDDELTWLGSIDKDGLTDAQKHGLVVARRTGKVTNAALRDLCGLDTLAASRELRALRDKGLLVMKGKAAGTFYVLDPSLLRLESAESEGAIWEAPHMAGEASAEKWGAPAEKWGAPAEKWGAPAEKWGASVPQPPTLANRTSEAVADDLPDELRLDLKKLGKRSPRETVVRLIVDLCRISPRTPQELARLLRRNQRYLTENILSPLVAQGILVLAYPDKPAHPNQAYCVPSAPKEGDD